MSWRRFRTLLGGLSSRSRWAESLRTDPIPMNPEAGERWLFGAGPLGDGQSDRKAGDQ